MVQKSRKKPIKVSVYVKKYCLKTLKIKKDKKSESFF